MLEGSSHSRPFSSPVPATPEPGSVNDDTIDDLFDGELEPEQQQLSVEVDEALELESKAKLEAELREMYEDGIPGPSLRDDYLAIQADDEDEEAEGAVNERITQSVGIDYAKFARPAFSYDQGTFNHTVRDSHITPSLSYDPSSPTFSSSEVAGRKASMGLSQLRTGIHVSFKDKMQTAGKYQIGFGHHQNGPSLPEDKSFPIAIEPNMETPTEAELENIDFTEVLEQIKSKHTRQALHEAEPSLTRKELFRAYREAVRKSASEQSYRKRLLIEDEPVPVQSNTAVSPDESVIGMWPSVNHEKHASNASDDWRNRSVPSERRCSSLMRSRPYLSDSSPIDIVGPAHKRFPHSPQRSVSRNSLLSAEAFPTLSNVSVAGSTPNSFKVPSDSSTDDGSQDVKEAVLPLPAAGQIASPFLRPTTPASRGRSSPLRRPIEIEISSVRAERGSPVPNPKDLPSRPDTPRPFDTDANAPEQFQLGPAAVPCSPCTPSRSQRTESNVVSSDSDLSNSTSRDEPMLTSNAVISDSNALQSLEAAGLHEQPRTPPINRTEILTESDPFASGDDEIMFTSIEDDASPELEKLTGLAGKIYQAKRGHRGQKQRTATARAVSSVANPKKNVPATQEGGAVSRGRARSEHLKVQGRGVKVSKSRSRSRRVSGRATTMSKIARKGSIPDVPPLPEDMDLDDLPLTELQPLSSPISPFTKRNQPGSRNQSSAVDQVIPVDTTYAQLKTKPSNARKRTPVVQEETTSRSRPTEAVDRSPPRSRAPRTPRSKKNTVTTKRTPRSAKDPGDEDLGTLRRSPRVAKSKNKAK